MTIALLIFGASLGAAAPEVVAKIDGEAITADSVRLALAVRGVTESPTPRLREATIENLIERRLIGRFLDRRETDAARQQLARAVAAAQEALEKSGEKSVDEQVLSQYLAVPLAWRKHVRRVITEDRIREYFTEHKRRFDGSRVRASQIFLKYQQGENADEAPRTREKLAGIRESIIDGQTTFAEAARANSQAPTAGDGGGLGWIGPQGEVPRKVSEAAFTLKAGEVSRVILTPFGGHLVTVTEVEPGDLSVEDARTEIIAELSRRLWDETVASERAKAEIQISDSLNGAAKNSPPEE